MAEVEYICRVCEIVLRSQLVCLISSDLEKLEVGCGSLNRYGHQRFESIKSVMEFGNRSFVFWGSNGVRILLFGI